MPPTATASTTTAPAPSTKRKLSHTSRACASCRRRRSKCDGGQPCGTCVKTQAECSYDDQLDGRKVASKPYVESLHQRIRALEAMLDAAGLDHGAGDLAGAEERPSKGKEKAVEVAEGQGSDGEGTVQAIQMLKIDDDTGELRQYGPQSSFAHLPGPASPAEVSNAFSPSSASVRSEVGLWPPAAETPGTVDWSRHLPVASIPGFDESLHEHMLDLFFNYFEPWCGWTSGAAGPNLFRRDLAVVLAVSASSSTPERTAHYSPMLHNAILALAVVYCTDSRITSVPAGVFFSSVAKDSVESEVERPMLSTLQGLMLLGSVHSGAGKHGAGYFWGGGGMKMATTLGLGIDATPHVHKGLISEETKDERERAHWFSFIQDKLWASYVGRPPTITSAHYETPLPRIFKEKDEVLWHSRIDPTDEEDIELPSFASTTFHWTARLAILAEKISNAVYALKVDVRAARTRAIASDLHLQLGQFYDSIPPAISISAHSNKPHPTHVILLHMWYWFELLLLHRPFYPRKRDEPSTPTTELAVKACEKSAAKLVQLFQLHQRVPGLRYTVISATQVSYTTGRALLLMALQSDKDSKKTASALANARLCVEFLDEMPWVCAKTTARDLERLIAEWNPVKEKKVVRARADPMLEALDPSSALARQLKALGWTPPVPGEQQLQPPRQVEQDAMQAVEQQQPAMAVDAQQGQDSAQQPMPFSFSPSPSAVSYDPSGPLLPQSQQAPLYPFPSYNPATSLPPSSSVPLSLSHAFPDPSFPSSWPQPPPNPSADFSLGLSQSPFAGDASMLALFESQAQFGMPVGGGWSAAGYGGLGSREWEGFAGWGEGGAGTEGL